MARKRVRWRRHQGKLDPRRLVFIDETWAKTNMTRTHGRAQRGVRLLAKVPHGHWRTSTFLAALRVDAITAPCVVDGPINGATFLAYVEQILVPTLSPGDIFGEMSLVFAEPTSATVRADQPAMVLFLDRETFMLLLDRVPQMREYVLDLDMVRRALGEAKMNYLGVSYGTRVGAAYMKLFPQQARAMILDSVSSPADDNPAATLRRRG